MHPRFARVRVQNDRLANAAKTHRFDDTSRVPFLCECDDFDCQAFVDLSLPEYTALQTVVYFVAPGHTIAEGDRTAATPEYDLFLIRQRRAAAE